MKGRTPTSYSLRIRSTQRFLTICSSRRWTVVRGREVALAIWVRLREPSAARTSRIVSTLSRIPERVSGELAAVVTVLLSVPAPRLPAPVCDGHHFIPLGGKLLTRGFR